MRSVLFQERSIIVALRSAIIIVIGAPKVACGLEVSLVVIICGFNKNNRLLS
jgi:hypothetical protein